MRAAILRALHALADWLLRIAILYLILKADARRARRMSRNVQE